ncbi:MAG: NHLP leader peptide family RiPP precursor [Phycisphaerales bacterium]|nr:NHLP leader peptide family RiPP precursor [Phycisphaerales bacterium]
MNNESNALSDLFAACWNDAALKERFMQDPKAVMAEHGIDVPEGMDVNIVENSDTCMNITMPAPPQLPTALNDHELKMVAGGFDSAVYADCFNISYIECVRSAPGRGGQGGQGIRRF